MKSTKSLFWKGKTQLKPVKLVKLKPLKIENGKLVKTAVGAGISLALLGVAFRAFKEL